MWGRALLLAAALQGSAACGYRFASPASSWPGGVRQVAVPVFANATSEPGLEALLTGLVREEVHRAGRLGGEGAEATLEGSVQGLASSQLVLAVQGRTTYRVGLTLALKLKKGDAVLGQAQVSGSEDYPGGADLLWTEANRGRALQRLAQQLARDAVVQLAPGT